MWLMRPAAKTRGSLVVSDGHLMEKKLCFKGALKMICLNFNSNLDNLLYSIFINYQNPGYALFCRSKTQRSDKSISYSIIIGHTHSSITKMYTRFLNEKDVKY